MVVQHNLTAMNSNRMLGLTTASQAKSTEKLSSGYKINRAADDAAGLAISEKMRKQVRGLTQASANAQDGISAVQTAEGALTEVHDMLQRMNELATKAANGSMSEDDRQYVQDEMDQLQTEIDRVAETTKFNEIYLLKGDAEGGTSKVKAAAHDAGLAGKLTDNGDTATFVLDSKLEDGDKISIAGKEYTIGSGNTGDVDTFKAATEVPLTGTAAAKTLGAENVNAGDQFYDSSTDTTYTLVDKVTYNSSGPVGVTPESGKDKITITDTNGNSSTYTIDGSATDLSTGNEKVKWSDAQVLIDDALAAGSSVSYYDDSSKKSYEVVSSLEQNKGGTYEISAASVTGGVMGGATGFINAVKTASGEDTGFKVAEGDIVTIGGKTTTITDNKPMEASNITSVMEKLQEGDKVVIHHMQDNGTETTKAIEIGKETNASANLYTVADAISLIGEKDDVVLGIQSTNVTATNAAKAAGFTMGTAGEAGADYVAGATATAGISWSDAFTAIGDSTSSDKDTISKVDALNMIAEELQKASNIGTDSDASVVNNGDGSFTIKKGEVEVKDALSFGLHVGADADMTNKIGIKIDAMDAAGLGVKGLDVSGKDSANATYAIDAIEAAIKKVSTQRSALGAAQNRLEHTINNLDNVVENTTSAESQIRDTDMATEMVKYANNNILAQAGQSMLAQANQSNQGVLSLLG